MGDVIAKVLIQHLPSCDESAAMFDWGDRWMREWRSDRPGIELRDSLGRRHRYGSPWEVWCCNLQFDCPAKAVISQHQTYLLMNEFLREATAVDPRLIVHPHGAACGCSATDAE